MAIRELAMEIEGFDDLPQRLNQDEQPPVINEKTGKPYDLNDPDFPVVKGHKFKYRYWAMTKDPGSLVGYLKEHWDYFNKTRFHGKMEQPTLALLRNLSGATARTRGLWQPGLRKLSIAPSMFKAPHEGWVNRVLIHEMAHQYVTDFEGGERVEGGHGPKWQATMRWVGLPPMRYDTESRDTFLTKVEKQDKAIQEQKFQRFQQKLSQRVEEWDRQGKSGSALKQLTNPKIGMMTIFIDPLDKVRIGEIVDGPSEGGNWIVYSKAMKKRYTLRPERMFIPVIDKEILKRIE